MQITYRLDGADVKRYAKELQRKQKKVFIRLTLLYSVIIFVIEVMTSRGLQYVAMYPQLLIHILMGAFYSTIFTALVMILFMFFLTPLIVTHQFRKDPDVFNVQTIEITPELFHRSMPFFDVRIQWPGIKDVVGDKHAIYIYYARRAAYMIPKRVFATPDQAIAFYDTACAYREGRDVTVTPETAAAGPQVWPPAPKP